MKVSRKINKKRKKFFWNQSAINHCLNRFVLHFFLFLQLYTFVSLHHLAKTLQLQFERKS
jgi:hypothetical protein